MCRSALLKGAFEEDPTLDSRQVYPVSPLQSAAQVACQLDCYGPVNALFATSKMKEVLMLRPPCHVIFMLHLHS